MDVTKVVLGVMTVIGLLADLLSDDDFLSMSIEYTHLKQRKTMSIGSFSGFCNMSECAAILLT